MNLNEHLLVCLNEECTEIAKDACKSLRFGLDDIDPKNGNTSRENLVEELNDLMGVIRICEETGILPMNWSDPQKHIAKIDKINKMLVYSREHGTL